MSTENQSSSEGGCPFNHQSQEAPVTTASKCPMNHAAGSGTSNQDWWPNQLKVDILHQHDAPSNPMDSGFDYAKEFESLDYDSLKQDLRKCNDRFSGLVACRFWSLWTFFR